MPSRGPQPATRQPLGTDAEGYHHVLDRSAGVVVRFDDRCVECVTDLTTTPKQPDQRLCDYWEFIAEDVGWDTLRFVPLLQVFDA